MLLSYQSLSCCSELTFHDLTDLNCTKFLLNRIIELYPPGAFLQPSVFQLADHSVFLILRLLANPSIKGYHTCTLVYMQCTLYVLSFLEAYEYLFIDKNKFFHNLAILW